MNWEFSFLYFLQELRNPVLDKIAVSAAKIFMDKCAPENRNGVLTFVWRAGAFENSGEKK